MISLKFNRCGCSVTVRMVEAELKPGETVLVKAPKNSDTVCAPITIKNESDQPVMVKYLGEGNQMVEKELSVQQDLSLILHLNTEKPSRIFIGGQALIFTAILA